MKQTGTSKMASSTVSATKSVRRLLSQNSVILQRGAEHARQEIFGHVPILEGASSGNKKAKKAFTGSYLEKYYPVSINHYARKVSTTTWDSICGNFLRPKKISHRTSFEFMVAEWMNWTNHNSLCSFYLHRLLFLVQHCFMDWNFRSMTVGRQNKRNIDGSNWPRGVGKARVPRRKGLALVAEKRRGDGCDRKITLSELEHLDINIV